MKKCLMILLVTVFCFCGAVYATDTNITDEIDSGEIIYDEGYEVTLDGVESEYLYIADELTFDILKGTVVEAGEVYEEDGGYTVYSYQDVKVYIKDKGYATTKDLQKLETKFTTVVGDITQLNTYNADNPQTIIQELNAINERLKWEDIPV